MSSQAPTSPLRQMLEGQLSQLSSEVERLFDEARSRARRELADQLNLSVRRIRHSGSLHELTATLVDAAMSFAAGVAVFRVDGALAKGERIRGVSSQAAAGFSSLEIPLSAAPALAGAVESRDPVTTVTTAAEVSPALVSLAGHPPDGRASVFPLAVTGRVPVLLYCWGAMQAAALEMLAQVAAAVWDTLTVPEAPQLVAIAPAPASAWDALTAEDQAIHLRAQRFARVRIAEMRLHDAAAVQAGRTERDLYGALRARDR